jgi:predicted nucleotidyltransferase
MGGLEILESNRSEIEALCVAYGVDRLRVFGSATRADWNPESSDFDFIADFAPPPAGIDLFQQQFSLLVKLERVLGRSVDLVDASAITKPIFREIIEAEGREWYAA